MAMDIPKKPPNHPSDTADREQASPQPTIVGGRPPERSAQAIQIPRGIEVLVKKAAVDPEFRSLLLDKRSEAAQAIELDLTTAERAMLNAVPVAQIERIIESTYVPDEHRRVFLGKVGTAMLAVVAAVTVGGWVQSPTGIRPVDEFESGGKHGPDKNPSTPRKPPNSPVSKGSRPDDPGTEPIPPRRKSLNKKG